MDNQFSSNGIADMGGNMNGTPITQLISNFPSPPKQNYFQQNYSDESTVSKKKSIKKIIDELNNDNIKQKKLKNKKKKNTKTDEDNDSKENKEDKEDKEDKEEDDDDIKYKKSKNIIPEILKDLLLIWVIFIILSNGIIKNFIAKYINAINPDDTGVVRFKGIAVYGLLLASLYVIIKLGLKYFNKY